MSFVQDVKCGYICIPLYAFIQFNQHPFVKKLSFLQCVFLASLTKNQVSKGVSQFMSQFSIQIHSLTFLFLFQ